MSDLYNVKEGDVLIFESSLPSRPNALFTVERVTTSEIIFDKGNCKYRKMDGHQVGQENTCSSTGWIRLPRNEHEINDIKEKEKKRVLINFILRKSNYTTLDNLTIDDLELITSAIRGVTTP